uniref:Capsid protein n=1 Tax=Dengue virus type 1 TaxID=11053 RepID=A0A1B4XSU7_DENV1|nr:capsid protein [dengue virus type 1]
MLKRARNRIKGFPGGGEISEDALRPGPMKLLHGFLAFLRFLAILPTAGILARWGSFKKNGAIKVLRSSKKESQLGHNDRRRNLRPCSYAMLTSPGSLR